MTDNSNLYEQLYNYGNSDYYPYHMPGHKRRQLGQMPQQVTGIDITEIDGFDNLHQPEGILKDLQAQAALLYGADETFYMVNGSTGGILSAVSAALPEGGHLLMARGCHKSAYHAVYLRKLRVSYLYGKQTEGFEFQEAITAEQVEEALIKEPDIQAVLIVSPTYEGRIADVAEIARVVHRRNIPLIVDEAHGAHLGFASPWQKNSCMLGADLVIHSVHKTLPSMTQAALLHVNGQLVDRHLLKRFLHIYQTSSPSYVLMASVQDAMQIIQKQGVELFRDFWQRYYKMYRKLEQCRVLKFIPISELEEGRQDIGKLVISTAFSNISGQWIYDKLRDNYHLQCEMATGTYCLAMFTVADTQEGYERMTQALLELDEYLTDQICSCSDYVPQQPELPQAVYSLTEAWNRDWEMTEMSEIAGKTAAEFIYLYPPGIPLLVPGEVISSSLCEKLTNYQQKKLNVQGVIKREGKKYVRTLK